ncbi:MAG: tetratricopeptide repeat protein, partial [Planctomycetota bacterium]
MITLFAAVALVSLAQESSIRRFPAQGFSIGAPAAGWSINGGRKTPSGFQVHVVLDSGGGLVTASVLTLAVPKGTEADGLLTQSVEGLPERSEYLEHQVLETTTLADLPAPGVRIEWEAAAAGRLSIVQRYVVSEGRGYLLQAHAPLEDWEERWPALESCLRSFRLIEPTSDERDARAIARLAAMCGSEADWAEDWEDAMERARASGRHALVVVHSYPGFDLPDSTAFSTFMDEDVLALVRTRLVPLRLEAGAPAPIRDPASYGMSPSTFGVALLLVNADGDVLADTPHVDPEACLPWLRGQLAKHPDAASVPELADPLDRVELRLDRGELGLAAGLLRDQEFADGPLARARALVLKARLHRLRHEGPEALEALAEAREISPEDAASIDCERAMVLFREGRMEDARELVSVLIDGDANDVTPKALVVMAAALQFLEGVDDAIPLWERVTEEYPDSRWAWQAAIRLDNLELLRGGESGGALSWPRRDVLAFLDEPSADPRGVDHVEEARVEAGRWLCEHQRSDGSWPYSTDLRRSSDLPP